MKRRKFLIGMGGTLALTACGKEEANILDPNHSNSIENLFFTFRDEAWIIQDGEYIVTFGFYGNPLPESIKLPEYGFVLYDENYKIVRLSFGGFYETLEVSGFAYNKRDTIESGEILRPWCSTEYIDSDIYNIAPLYYENFISNGYEEEKIESYLSSFIESLGLNKANKKMINEKYWKYRTNE